VPWDPSFWKTPDSFSERESSIRAIVSGGGKPANAEAENDPRAYVERRSASPRVVAAIPNPVQSGWKCGMSRTQQLTALIEREGDGYVSLCPELDVASQGNTVEEARDNLVEALELFFEVASSEEIERRLKGELYVTRVNVKVG
jgi:predicted RNase H-like HicB family nuclease